MIWNWAEMFAWSARVFGDKNNVNNTHDTDNSLIIWAHNFCSKNLTGHFIHSINDAAIINNLAFVNNKKLYDYLNLYIFFLKFCHYQDKSWRSFNTIIRLSWTLFILSYCVSILSYRACILLYRALILSYRVLILSYRLSCKK